MIPIVIPYYKKLGRLLKCKRHLRKQTMAGVIHIVNDNARHSGYTAAVNRGLRYWLNRASQWDYIVVLDQDMYLDPDAIKIMFEFMESRPKCGIAVCLQQRKDNPLIVQGGGFDCYPVGLVEEGHISYYENDKPIFWGDLACFMVRKECIWDIGLLDENFRFIASDSDYTLTARSKGWEVWIPAGAKGVHQKGAAHPSTYKNLSTEETNKVPIVQQMARDQLVFEKKWVNPEFYTILRHEKKKPIFIIKEGKAILCEGQPYTAKEMKKDWLRKEENVVGGERAKRDGSLQVSA